jgi:hypothetical protein
VQPHPLLGSLASRLRRVWLPGRVTRPENQIQESATPRQYRQASECTHRIVPTVRDDA